MNKNNHNIISYVILPLIVFVFSFFLRRYFFCGFILGDDLEELHLIKHIYKYGPGFQGHLQYRFGLWCFNVIAFKLFGISEFSFFLPTWVMSSSLAVAGYFILIREKQLANCSWQKSVGNWQTAVGKNQLTCGKDKRNKLNGQNEGNLTNHTQNGYFLAFLASLFIASAPFEILIGTIRANDLILSWFLVLSFLFFVIFESRSVIQGILIAIFLWLAFYTKLWAIYFLPAISFFYLFKLIKNREWKGVTSFTISSLVVHIITCVYWKIKIGLFIPFLNKFSATYPVAIQDLKRTFWFYPEMILNGSEFGTTLFGSIPYILFFLLICKFTVYFASKRLIARFDKFDIYLSVYYGSFFILLNFFPNSFKFDQYYSAPRIFRYMAPISFPMTLHIAKLTIELIMYIKLFKWENGIFKLRAYICFTIFVLLIILNIYQTNNATRPGKTYRRALLSILEDIKIQSPPIVISEAWLSSFLREIYLRSYGGKISIPPIHNTHNAVDYELWLLNNQNKFPDGTMLISGIGSYLYYGAHHCGFRLARFNDKLSNNWQLSKEYEMLDYLTVPEKARLWRFSESDDSQQQSDNDLSLLGNPHIIFKNGMKYFDFNAYEKSKHYFKIILNDFPKSKVASDALYFYAICFFRENNYNKTIAEFERLIDEYPESKWISGAHYHIGICHQKLNNKEKARKRFQYVISHFESDKYMVNLAKERLREIQ